MVYGGVRNRILQLNVAKVRGAKGNPRGIAAQDERYQLLVEGVEESPAEGW